MLDKALHLFRTKPRNKFNNIGSLGKQLNVLTVIIRFLLKTDLQYLFIVCPLRDSFFGIKVNL